MSRILLARFHSLGDVVLATGIAVHLAEQGHSVEIATREAYRPLFDGLPLLKVHSPASLAGLPPFDRVIDLQSNATSRRRLRGLGPIQSNRSRSAARRWIVFWGRRPPFPKIPHAVLRYAEPAGIGSTPARQLRPCLAVTDDDTREGMLHPWAWERTARPTIALAPGASRQMKRWPQERFRALAGTLASDGLQTLIFMEPDGGEDLPESGIVRATLRGMKALLSRCSILVTNDSGVMHVAVGLGVPVVAIFGSTVREFGFAPLGEYDRLLERDLACRPCAPHGARFCWLGSGDCLRGIEVAEVQAAVRERLREVSAR